MELCLLNLLIFIDCFLCNSYPLFVKFGKNVPCSFFEILKSLKFFEISKFQKSELGKFIPNFPLKHVITITNQI